MSEETYFLFFLPILATVARSFLFSFAIFFTIVKSLLLCSFSVLRSGVSSISQSLVLWGKITRLLRPLWDNLVHFLCGLPERDLRHPPSWVPPADDYELSLFTFCFFLEVFILVSFTGVIRRVGHCSFFRLGG